MASNPDIDRRWSRCARSVAANNIGITLQIPRRIVQFILCARLSTWPCMWPRNKMALRTGVAYGRICDATQVSGPRFLFYQSGKACVCVCVYEPHHIKRDLSAFLAKLS